MNYYQDITLLPEVDISLSFIWPKVFQQVHIALVDNKLDKNQSAVAVSFPEFKQTRFPLGAKLRLFATEQHQLQQLNIANWLNRLDDYVHVKGIKAVPDPVKYVCFSRKNVKSPERIEKDMQEKAKRWSDKSGLSMAESLQQLAKTKPQANCDLPFIFLHSQETKRRSPDKSSQFPLFIQMERVNEPLFGAFDCYGLSGKGSQIATVPWF
ncbi:type I-F CRISPR-associated endoribonuclease Cas6/Csy4 [uncultured Shewanella sp.]|uniref:type I-F CRISPR-associated endoribonuclease Cas6/Csy4 n=1 Tax=uncultured Shewanella sp. TaxID=173975 RepID=UPI00262A813A|nr:type I-F CRISPR-associated endoribonuclease Cas6/Csy4 [uncultured Shewanella sp.]